MGIISAASTRTRTKVGSSYHTLDKGRLTGLVPLNGEARNIDRNSSGIGRVAEHSEQ